MSKFDAIKQDLGMMRKASVSPYGYFSNREVTPTSISNFISKVQFERMAHDIGMWREAIREMELAFNPMRVRVNRMYMDVIENPYIKALFERRSELTIQRDIEIYQMKGSKKIVSEDLTQALNSQYWFKDYLQYTLDSRWFGYTLIELGDMVNDSFPNITFTRRENIRPDGIDNNGSPILTSMVYAIDGIRVEEDPIVDLCNHWISTKSNIGISKCGYGLLYNVALLEIHLRHIMEWNADYVEMYGMPIKKGKTRKQGKDRKKFEQFLANAASNAYVLLDQGTEDDLEYVMAKEAGTAWKSYENLEQRLEDKACQIVLGHTDAIRSTAGKLGGQQTASKDGFNISIVEQAMIAKQISDGDFVCRKINEITAPKMRRLGKILSSKIIAGLFPEGYHFGLKNDKEEQEVKRRDNADKEKISIWTKNMNDAGWDIDPKQLSDRFGMKLTPATPEHKLIQERNTKTQTTTLRLDEEDLGDNKDGK